MVVLEVCAKNHANVVKLESLSGVDTADLTQSFRIVGPSQRLRNPFGQPLRLGSRIPWSLVASDSHVVCQSAVWFRVRPRPAETRSHPGSKPRASLPQNHLLERLGGFHQSELERLVATPKRVRGLFDVEGVVDP